MSHRRGTLRLRARHPGRLRASSPGSPSASSRRGVRRARLDPAALPRRGPARPLPRQTRGHTLLEIAWTIAPALVLLVIAIPTIQVIFRTQARGAPPRRAGGHGARLAVVVGVPLPDARRRHRQRAAHAGRPAGRPRPRGPRRDPQLLGAAARRQARRGPRPRSTRSRSRPSAPGEYWGQCAEFCGASHANMRLRVIVDAPAEFERWVAAQKRGARRSRPAAGRGRQGDLRAQRVRRLPHDPRRVGGRARPRPHPLRQPQHARRRALAEHARERGRVDQGPAGAEAGRRRCRTSASRDDAGQGAGRLPAQPEVDGAATVPTSVSLVHAPPPRRGARHGARVLELAHHRRPQAHRHPLRRDRLRVLPPRRDRGAASSALQLARPERHAW